MEFGGVLAMMIDKIMDQDVQMNKHRHHRLVELLHKQNSNFPQDKYQSLLQQHIKVLVLHHVVYVFYKDIYEDRLLDIELSHDYLDASCL
jgi:hypothetical protein